MRLQSCCNLLYKAQAICSWSPLCLLMKNFLGSVSKESLGRTLTHEHFNLNFEAFYCPPPKNLEGFFSNDICLENVGYIKQYPYSSQTNLQLFGAKVNEAILEELKLYKKFGGGCIVENSSHGLNRNLNLMVEASKESGVHVIAGTGHYTAAVQTASALHQTVEQIYNIIKTDIEIGCKDNPQVKCGFIGEVGSSWPIHDFEKRCIQATAEAQSELGCGVSFHPGRDHRAPWEILRLYTEAGGDIQKAVMSHLDRTILTEEELLEFGNLGSYCQFDLFGTECSFYQLSDQVDMPSDARRIELIISLIKNSKEDKILMSHDIHTRHKLVKFGGHGFSHILNNVVPKMRIKDISNPTIDQILINNPSEWLCHKSK